jgi:hypothetical protein
MQNLSIELALTFVLFKGIKLILLIMILDNAYFIAKNHSPILIYDYALANVKVWHIKMLIIRQTDASKLVLKIPNIIQIIEFVYSFAQLQIILLIKMVEYALLDVLILQLYNMEIKEQENVKLNAQKELGEITQQIFVFQLAL